MKFFFAENLDVVDPDYDFYKDQSVPDRNRQSVDVYPHELLGCPPYDGILISRSSIGGTGAKVRYSQGQRLRIMREGIREFLRFPYKGYTGNVENFPIMGDCGAFSYAHLKSPPFSTSDIADFYESCGFTHGISPDHIIFEKDDKWDMPRKVPPDILARSEYTLKSAIDFINIVKKRNFPYVPVGAIQAWNPASFVKHAEILSHHGYTYLALGGLAARPAREIYNIVAEVRDKLPSFIKIHLLGFTRFTAIEKFIGLSVDSFDSSSPMIRAFKDDYDNYYWPDGRHYAALKIPRLTEKKMKNKILTGKLIPEDASKIETECLDKVRACARGEVSPQEALNALLEYESLWTDRTKMAMHYKRTIVDKPWKQCPCAICKKNGVEIVIYRGLNRNKRRGGHNLYVFYNKLKGVKKMDILEVPCIRAEQCTNRTIFSFVVDGKDIPKFATTSRIMRDEAGNLAGYQRPEILNHITEIKDYLDGQDAMLPNSLVVAFNLPLKFRKEKEYGHTTSSGVLEIPIGGNSKAGWIVDGQQRAAAMRSMKRETLPISIIGFESMGVDDERKQFVLTNNTRPLAKSLVYELLPCLSKSVPAKLKKRQRAYIFLEKLSLKNNSPFFGRIKMATTGHLETANIKDLSVLKMIENSMDNGVINKYQLEEEKSLSILMNYWSAVKSYYSDAWGLPPHKSRLTHGAGIISMGYIMDVMCYRLSNAWDIPPENSFVNELEFLGVDIAWTDGIWRFSEEMILPWNEIQNTSKHIELMTNYLIRRYKTAIKQTIHRQAPGDKSFS